MGLKWLVIKFFGVGGRGGVQPFSFFPGFLFLIFVMEDFSFDEREVSPFFNLEKIGKVKFKFDDDGLVLLSTVPLSSLLYFCSLFLSKLACPRAAGTFELSLSESGIDVQVFLLAN